MTKLFIYGNNRSARVDLVKKTKNNFSKKHSSFNIEELDFSKDNISIQDFQNKLQSVPFLAKKRLVVINDLFSSRLFKGKGGVVSKRKKIVINQLDATPSSTILVINENDSIHYSVANSLKKVGFEIKKIDEDNNNLEQWLIDKANQLNINIDRKEAQLMIERLGAKSGIIYQELIKLRDYLAFDNRNRVEQKDIELVVGARTNLKIFDLMDQVANKNKAKAVEYLYEMLGEGVSEIYIIAMLDSTITNLILASELKESNNNFNLDKLKKRFGWHPYVAQKVYSQINHFNKKALINIYQKLYLTDLRLKSSSDDPKTRLTLFLSQL